MPYYCTVPRCTSMAGKTKNVSFHQFPRDEQLAALWNKILKRGKPYTKYSKVCSLHFRPEDYTITSVGKNKGQWRTLRKDAIPSQNLPSESPVAARRNSHVWTSGVSSDVVNPTMQQQVAQAIYMQTMLAMQAQAAANGCLPTQSHAAKPDTPHPSSLSIAELENLLRRTPKSIESMDRYKSERNTSYKCLECSKCFMDPDVFVLHNRSHRKQDRLNENISVALEKENLNTNSDVQKATLQANPILANLLKSDVPNSNVIETSNVISIENHIMTALTTNMESYIRSLGSLLSQRNSIEQESETNQYSSNEDDCEDGRSSVNKRQNSVDEQQSSLEQVNGQQCSVSEQQNPIEEQQNQSSMRESEESFGEWRKSIQKSLEHIREGLSSIPIGESRIQDFECIINKSTIQGSGPCCDNQDLSNSKDSVNLVIDENA